MEIVKLKLWKACWHRYTWRGQGVYLCYAAWFWLNPIIFTIWSFLHMMYSYFYMLCTTSIGCLEVVDFGADDLFHDALNRTKWNDKIITNPENENGIYLSTVDQYKDWNVHPLCSVVIRVCFNMLKKLTIGKQKLPYLCVVLWNYNLIILWNECIAAVIYFYRKT